MSTPRIVVTGIGASSPLGGTAPESWEGLLAGHSGTRTLEHEWVEKYQIPVHFAAEAIVRPDTVLERPVSKRLDPASQFAMVAAMEAWADAGSPEVDPERLGVDFATGIGGVWTLLDAWDTLREKGPRRVLPMTVPMLMPNAAAGNLSLHFRARAFARTVASACASSTESIVNAIEHLQDGLADIVIAGGTESAIHPITMASFASMQALSRRNDDPATASRPTSIDRDGFVMGEGAGVLILETEEHAKARGAKIYAYAVGGGVTADSYHITANDPEGAGASRAVRAALEQADASPMMSRTSMRTRPRPRRRPQRVPGAAQRLRRPHRRDPGLGHEGVHGSPAGWYRCPRGDLHDPGSTRTDRAADDQHHRAGPRRPVPGLGRDPEPRRR